MKTRSKIHSKKILLLAAILLCMAFQSRAGSYMGSDLTYIVTAPNVYVVTARIYRDCSGPALNPAETLTLRSDGCNAGRTVMLQLISGSAQAGSPFCPVTMPAAACNPNATLPNYEAAIYQATVTFSAAEQQCSNWIFSMSLGNRSKAENLVSITPLYTEAYLNLDPAIHNNSVEFPQSGSPIIFSCPGREVVFSATAFDADGDSLSYELLTPLAAFNTSVPYASAHNITPDAIDPVTGNGMIYNRNVTANCSSLYKSNILSPDPRPLQWAVLPASQPAAYSASYPITSYHTINWQHCQQNIPVVHAFSLNAANGILQFTPQVYFPNTNLSDGRNKYAVVVKINEWRKVNGVVTKVGSVRREMMVLVTDCAAIGGNNTLPYLVIDPPNPLFPPSNDTVKHILACQTTRFVLKFRDNNPTDSLTVQFPDWVPGANFPGIPGLVMQQYTNNRHEIDVVFYMTPSPNDIGKSYFLRVFAEDNGCPMRGRLEQLIRLQITGDNLAAIVGGNYDRTIALGQSAAINVFFGRPDSILQAPAVYQYRWTDTDANGGLPNGLNAADQFTKNIVVNPTQTTRYFLTITSNLSGCQDTVSALVRVTGTTGIAGNVEAGGFSVFPNPFSNEVNFSMLLPQKHSCQLIIYSILGKEIDRLHLKDLPAGKQTVTWENAHKLPAGQYLARLVSEKGQVQTIKFTKLY